MTQFNAIGEAGLNDVLTRRLNTPGGSNAPSVAPEIFPVLALESDRPEWLHLAGSERFARHATAAAGGAGTRSSVSLVNSNLQLLTVVEYVRVVVASGVPLIALLTIAIGTIPFGTAFRGLASDSRNRNASGVRQSECQGVTDNTLGSLTQAQFSSDGTALVIETPFVMAPGSRLYIAPSADNVAINSCQMVWRERAALPGELA